MVATAAPPDWYMASDTAWKTDARSLGFSVDSAERFFIHANFRWKAVARFPGAGLPEAHQLQVTAAFEALIQSTVLSLIACAAKCDSPHIWGLLHQI
jgi:hypothetical protein